MRICLWVVGEPGIGKTTLVRKLLGPNLEMEAKPKWTWNDSGICAAGHYTGGTFDGADTVPYNGVKVALDYWEARMADHNWLTIFDGDRFSHKGTIERTWEIADPRVALLCDDGDLGAKRRAERGATQNASWVAGRKTKALNFATRAPGYFKLDARKSVDDLASEVVTLLLGGEN